MSAYSIFDITGPVMVGPSSSHTAGAVKIGQIARALFNKTPKKVTFYLHGSFATVYKGHSTDKALLGGIMKFTTKDPRIKEAFRIAKQKKIKYSFKEIDLGIHYHPNSVKIVLEAGKHKMSVIGSSIGGGNITINKIDEFEVNIKGVAGKYFTLIISHKNIPGILATITSEIAKTKINIANIQNTRLSAGGKALTIIALDGKMTLKQVQQLQDSDPNIDFVRALTKLN